MNVVLWSSVVVIGRFITADTARRLSFLLRLASRACR
jgi:hypothetical protein